LDMRDAENDNSLRDVAMDSEVDAVCPRCLFLALDSECGGYDVRGCSSLMCPGDEAADVWLRKADLHYPNLRCLKHEFRGLDCTEFSQTQFKNVDLRGASAVILAICKYVGLFP
jgi:hypothetical protein